MCLRFSLLGCVTLHASRPRYVLLLKEHGPNDVVDMFTICLFDVVVSVYIFLLLVVGAATHKQHDVTSLREGP